MKLAIGIDLGGTKIYGILINEKGKILKHYRRPTEAHKSRGKIIDNIVEVINRLKTKGVIGVGIATPGFEKPDGRLSITPNIERLRNFNLRKALQQKTKMKIILENDANCFALAEHKAGAAKGCKNAIGVIMGTGVGSGVIIDNKIYSGSTGGAAEAGHIKIVVNNEIKEVEGLISGPNIVKRYEEVSGKRAYSPRVILKKKDKFAKQVYDEVVLYTGLFFSNLIYCFSPEVIVVGGGVSNLPFYKDVRKTALKHTSSYLGKSCKIKKHAISSDSGAIGAAQLVFCD